MACVANMDIRDALKRAGVRQWQLAEAVGMSEDRFSRRMRHPLSVEEKAHLLRVIQKIQEVQ